MLFCRKSIRWAVSALLLLVLLGTTALASGSAGGAFIIHADRDLYYSARGLMDTEGNILLQTEYSDIYALHVKSDSTMRYAVAQSTLLDKKREQFETRYALFDERGKALTDFQYNYITRLGDGRYMASIFTGKDESEYETKVLDASGDALFTCAWDDTLIEQEDGYIFLSTTTDEYLSSLTDERSLVRLDAQFKEIESIPLPGSGYPIYGYPDEQAMAAGKRVHAYALMVTDPKTELQGVYGMDGKVIIPVEYQRIDSLSEGLYALYRPGEELCALADASGRPLTEAKYDHLFAHSLSLDNAFIEGRYMDESVLIGRDGKELTKPGQFAYFDNWSSLEFAIGFANYSQREASLIYPNGDIRPLPQDIAQNYNVLDANTILTLSFPEDSASYSYLTNPQLYSVDTGKRVPLDFGEEQPLGGGYGHKMADGRYFLTVAPNNEQGFSLGATISRIFDASGSPVTPYLYNAYTVVMDETYIVAQKGKGNLRLYGLLDANGDEVLPFRYTSLQCVDEELGVFSAQQGSAAGYIDLKGNWIHRTSAYADLRD